MANPESLYDRLQRNVEFLEDTQLRVDRGELPGMRPFEDVLAVCQGIEQAPADVSWTVREDIARLVDHLDTLIASIRAYEAAVKDGNDK